MNKKLQIGILTYFNAKNYGCVLQAYAMIHFFSKFGKTKIINYIPNYLDNQDKIINLDFLKKNLKFKERILLFKITISTLVKSIFLIERKNKFNNFVRKYLKINTKNKIIDEYGLSNLNKIDYYVFGSDQIWNSIFKKPVDTNYFGSFTKKKKIFFSASIRFAKINFFTKKIINCLQKAIYISVRESYVKKILKKLNIYANETLDPTLLVNKKLWLSLAKKSKIKLNKKYLLIYDLENNSNLQKYAYEISNKFNYEVVTILGYPKITKIFSNNVYQSIKPEDFCNFFLNAKFILTSSYHGLIFSIIFKKKFYINANKLNSFRILNLLNKFNLKKRFITKTNQINLIDKISFNLISKIILTEQQKTNKFLREVLK